MRGSMDDSGIPKILLSPEQSGIKNAITVSELRRSYRKLRDLSLESGAPVYITRGGDAGGVFFTMETFESFQKEFLLTLEEIVRESMCLKDIISVSNGEGRVSHDLSDEMRAESDS